MSQSIRPASNIGTDPQTSPRDRDELLAGFIRCVNIVKPDHPSSSLVGDTYPIRAGDVKYSYCQTYHGRCGPRSNGGVFFAINKSWANSVSDERLVVLYVHELTHIVEGYHTDGAGHSPDYWREFAFNMLTLLDDLRDLETIMGDLDEDALYRKAIESPVRETVDLRIESPAERSRTLCDLLGYDDYTIKADREDEDEPEPAELAQDFGRNAVEDERASVRYDSPYSAEEQRLWARVLEITPTHVRLEDSDEYDKHYLTVHRPADKVVDDDDGYRPVTLVPAEGEPDYEPGDVVKVNKYSGTSCTRVGSITEGRMPFVDTDQEQSSTSD